METGAVPSEAVEDGIDQDGGAQEDGRNAASLAVLRANYAEIHTALLVVCARKLAKHRRGAGFGQLEDGGLDAVDLAHDAIVAVFEGRRKLTATEPDELVRQLATIVESMLRNVLRHQLYERVGLPGEENDLPGGDRVDDDEIVLRATLEAAVADDPILTDYLRLRSTYEGDRKGIAREMNVLEVEVAAIHRRFVRRMEKVPGLREVMEDLDGTR